MIVRNILNNKRPGSVATATAAMPVTQAARILHRLRIGALVVMDQGDAITGILSERDLARGLALHGERLNDLAVRDLMTGTVLVCGPDDPVEKLMEIMTENRIRHLPVVDRGALVGIVSIGDVVKTCLADANLQVESLRRYVGGHS